VSIRAQEPCFLVLTMVMPWSVTNLLEMMCCRYPIHDLVLGENLAPSLQPRQRHVVSFLCCGYRGELMFHLGATRWSHRLGVKLLLL
jgi:hypothetical protein